MKRRQLLLATATISLAGIPGLSSAQSDDTDTLEVSDVTLEFGGATVTVGSASMAHQDDTLGLLGQDWTVTAEGREVSVDEAVVAVGNVDAETFAQLREGAVQSAGERSLSPALAAFAEADLDPDAPVQARIGPITSDQGPVADQVRATGTVDSVTPENWRAFGRGESTELGPVQFDTVTAQRGSVFASAENVVAEPVENAVSVTADGGTIETPNRVLEFESLDTTFRPPEEGSEPHAQALAGLRQLAANGSLTADAIATTIAESGVTFSNTMTAVRNTQFEATVGSVTEDGQTVVQDFGTSGTLAEMAQVLQQRL